MLPHTITLVAGKAILRIVRVEFDHESVAGHFGENAGRGDAQAEGIAFDQSSVIDGQTAHRQSVDEGMVGTPRQGFDGAGHGQMRGAQDVETIDFLHAGLGHGPEDPGSCGQNRVNPFTFGRADFFRIGQSIEREIIGQNDRGCDHGAGERTASGFVHPGDQKKTASTQGVLAA